MKEYSLFELALFDINDYYKGRRTFASVLVILKEIEMNSAGYQKDWVDQYKNEVEILEEIYSNYISDDDDLTKEDKETADKSISKIIELIKSVTNN